ncbi:helix-turn-helix transcriptional regulator [Teichococcus aerofrigidensis]
MDTPAQPTRRRSALLSTAAAPAAAGWQEPDPHLSAAEAKSVVGVSLSTFWAGVRTGRFPQPYYPSPKSPRWKRSELLAALEATRAAPVPAKAVR